MLDERKTAILMAVVQEYIATAQPVGSSHIAQISGIKVSSATVRNDMAALEQEGYLAQPHTSAGRVPTDKGYRLFVDQITPQGGLDVQTRQQVGSFFNSAHGRLEELLQSTTHLLSDLTKYAAVAVGPKAEVAVVRSIQVVGLNATHATVVVVLSNGSVESSTIEIPEGVGQAHLGAATVHLSNALVGRSLGAEITIMATGEEQVDELCQTAMRLVMAHAEDQPLYMGGASAMARAFDAVDTVRAILGTLEQQYVVVSLVRDVLDRGLSVAIGGEHGVEPLAACSVIVAPVVADGEHIGTVGVLGPTRMNYPRAMATVGVVSDELGRRLSES
jgi:heat-inducible transcriptional repressor